MDKSEQKQSFADLNGFLEKYVPEIESGLERYFPPEAGDFAEVFRISEELSPFNKKRIRFGILTLLGGAIFGENPEKLVPAACAVEFVENAGSILSRSELKAETDSPVRSSNLISGLSLLNSAYSLVFVDHFNELDRAAEAHREIVECIGAGGLIGSLNEISQNSSAVFAKTAQPVLTRLALRVGAILGGADYMDLAGFTRVAELLSEAQRQINASGSAENDRKRAHEPEVREQLLTAKRLLLENFPSNDGRSCLIQYAELLAD